MKCGKTPIFGQKLSIFWNFFDNLRKNTQFLAVLGQGIRTVHPKTLHPKTVHPILVHPKDGSS